MVTVEVAAVPGFVGITFTADDDRVELVLTADQARDLCQRGVRADLGRAHDQPAAGVDENDVVRRAEQQRVALPRMVAVVGPSGCGKSTLLELIAGLTPATEGTIEFEGHDLVRLPRNELRGARRSNVVRPQARRRSGT